MPNAMIWGASGGIGRAIVEALVGRDWTVIALSRDPENLKSLTELSFYANITENHSVQEAIMSAAYEVDEINLWIYAAGDITSSRVGEMTPEEWERIISANLHGPYLTTHHSLPLLAADAHLFFLGAVSERLRLPGLSAYAAAKAGLEAYAEALRKEERKRRITVVRPGAVVTPLWDKVPMRLPKYAAPPEKVAKRILSAFEEGHTGVLDLT